MTEENTGLVGGLYPKRKHPNAPDYVLAGLGINVSQFREWMQTYLRENPGEEWINLELKVSRAGKGYAALDTWKPEQSQGAPQQAATPPAADGFEEDSIPF